MANPGAEMADCRKKTVRFGSDVIFTIAVFARSWKATGLDAEAITRRKSACAVRAGHAGNPNFKESHHQMALIEESEAAAIVEFGDVSALLRKCKLLAARLDVKKSSPNGSATN